MGHVLFHRCSQRELLLSGCDLTRAEIIETPMKGVDLSDCAIDALRTSVAWLEGTTVSLAQAPALLSLCGIRLKL